MTPIIAGSTLSTTRRIFDMERNLSPEINAEELPGGVHFAFPDIPGTRKPPPPKRRYSWILDLRKGEVRAKEGERRGVCETILL